MAGTNIGTAWINIVPSFRGTTRRIATEIGGATQTVSRSASQRMARSFAGAFRTVGKVGTAAFAAVGAAATFGLDKAISRVDTLNNFPKVMRNLGYSSKEASAAITKMSDKLIGLPTQLDSLVGVTQRLAPLTGSLSKAADLSLALNNAFLASGASATDVARATEQYTQMLAKGSVDMQSWRTLQEVMPGQLDQIAKALLGPTANTQALYRALQTGTVSFDDFNNTILKLNDEGLDGFASFSQQAIDATKGIGTAWANVKTAMVRGKSAIIQALGAEEMATLVNKMGAGITKVANAIAKYIEKVKEADGPSKTLEDRFKGLATGATLLGASLIAGSNFDTFADTLHSLDAKTQSITTNLAKALSPTRITDAFSQLTTTVHTAFNTSLREAAIIDGDPFAPGIDRIAQGLKGLVPNRLAGAFTQMRTQVQTLFNKELRDAAVLDGDPFAGAVAKMREGGDRLARPFASVGGKVKEQISAGLGTIQQTPVVSSVQNVFGGVSDVMTQPFKTGMDKVGGAILSFFNPGNFLKFFGIGAIVAALVAGLGAMASQAGGAMLNEFAAKVAQLPDKLLTVVTQLAAQVPQFMTVGVDIILNLIKGLTSALPQIISQAATIITGLVSALGQNLPLLIPSAVAMILALVNGLLSALPQIISAGLDLLVGLVKGIVSALPMLIAAIPQIITSIISTLVGALPEIIDTGVELLTALIDGIVNAIPQLIAMLPQIINTTVTILVQNLPKIIEAGIRLLVALINGIVKALPQLATMLPQIIVTVVAVLARNLPQIVKAGWNMLVSLITGIVNALPQLWGTVRQIPGQILSSLGNVGRLLWNAGRSILVGLWNGMVSFFSTIRNGLRSFTNSIMQWKGPPKKDRVLLYGAGQMIIGGFQRGLESRYGAVKSSLRDFTNGLNAAGEVRPTLAFSGPRASGDLAGPVRPIQVVQNITHAEVPKASALASAGAAQARLQATLATAM